MTTSLALLLLFSGDILFWVGVLIIIGMIAYPFGLLFLWISIVLMTEGILVGQLK